MSALALAREIVGLCRRALDAGEQLARERDAYASELVRLRALYGPVEQPSHPGLQPWIQVAAPSGTTGPY